MTNGDIWLPGNGTFDLSMRAGGTANGTGGQSALGVGRVGSAAGGTCLIGRTACLVDQDPPDVTPFSFASARAALEDEAPACTMTLANPPSAHALSWATDAVICLGTGASLYLNGTATNTFMIGNATTTTVVFTGDARPATPGGIGTKIASGRGELRDGTVVTSNRLDVPDPSCGQTVGINVSGSFTEASLPDDIENPNVAPSITVRDPDAAGIKVLARRP